MGRIALVALALAGLSGPAALATSPLHLTAKGKLTTLTHRTVTVNGKSCRITPASPDQSTLRVFAVGGVVKIVCADGVLLEIDLLHPSTSSPSTSGQSVSSSSSSSTSSSANGASSSSTALAGSFPITAVGNDSISVAAPYVKTVTCKAGAGSPDLSGLKVGDVVTRMTCKDGVLTALTRG